MVVGMDSGDLDGVDVDLAGHVVSLGVSVSPAAGCSVMAGRWRRLIHVNASAVQFQRWI
jgi:hypothetical protein